MRRYSDRFKNFVDDCKKETYKSPYEVDPAIFSLEDWNHLPRKEAEEIFLPFIRYQIDRAMKTMPDVYLNAYKTAGIKPENINSIEDFWNLPPLPKDSTINNLGLREKIRQSGYSVVKPNDLELRGKTPRAYFSGGTMGLAVPTWVTEWDLEVEANASYRALLATGIKPGSVILNSYNISHKGGDVISRALCKLPGSTYIQIRTTDKASNIIEHIKHASRYGKELLYVGIQTPLGQLDAQQKGSGRTLFDLMEENAEVFTEQISRVLLGGFRIIPELEEFSKSPAGKPVTTIFGSTEIMPAFFGTPYDPENHEKLCVFNTLHEMLGPHYIEEIKYDNQVKKWIPAEPGDKGSVLSLTSVFREGTIYLRYLIGDYATILEDEHDCACKKSSSRLINNIKRIGKEGVEELLSTGCAAM